MKRLNNSQPLAVATQFRPLSTSMQIVTLGGLSTEQFYKQTAQEWIPDHSVDPTFNSDGSQLNGTLRLAAVYSVIDPDGLLDTDNLSPQVFWYVNDTQITTNDVSADYYVSNNILYVRKNFTHTSGAAVSCECRFTDMRTATPFVLSASASLTAVLQADEQWSLTMMCDKTLKHFPLFAKTSIYDFTAEAKIGATIKSGVVKWFWDYSTDNGQTWKDIDDTCYWYVSGKNAETLRVDMDFIESIMVRARIATSTSATAPNLPNATTASCAWRMPNIYPAVFSYGGDKVFSETQFMTFGVLCHVPGHDDLSKTQVAEWTKFNWGMRVQGSNAALTTLNDCHPEVTIPADKLFNTQGKKYVIDPQMGIRGVYDVIATSKGELIQVGDDLVAIRS